jgi:hypothetical protein
MFALRVVSRDQSPDVRAQRYVELARMALALPETRSRFRTAKMGFARASSVKQMDWKKDDRWESVASLDIWFNVVMDDAPVGEDQGTIGTVVVTGHLENQDGADARGNMDDEEISES